MDQEEYTGDVDAAAADPVFLEKLGEVFALFDRDSSGFIDPDELGTGLRALGCNPTDQEIQDMIADANEQVDSETGRLSFDGFRHLMLKYYKNNDDVQTELLQAFMVFDKDKSGGIDKHELRQALTSMGYDQLTDEEVDELFAEADTDNNNVIDYRELVTVMLK